MKNDTKTTPKPLHPEGRSRYSDVAKVVAVSEMTLRRWISKGHFPKPVKVNGIPFFENAEILNWLKQTGKQSE